MANTPIYSLLPADPIDPQTAEQLCFKGFRNEPPREQYPALPWCIEELVGSCWCNIHIGILNRIERTELGQPGKGGKIIPCFPSQFPSLESQDTPGFWWGPRFVIDHWIRIDHWPLQWQLTWLHVEVQYHRTECTHLQSIISTLQERPVSDPLALSLWTQNRNTTLKDLQGHRGGMERAIQRMRQFADRHQLQISLDMLNEGAENAGEPEQLRLF